MCLRHLTTALSLPLCRDLHGLGLQGTIAPNSIAQLQYLKSLDLSENSLTGSIPAGWNKDGALPSLYTLNLTSNQLAQAPADWGSDGCSALCELRLGKNELNTLPEGWTFVQLQRLELAGNRISGERRECAEDSWASV